MTRRPDHSERDSDTTAPESIPSLDDEEYSVAKFWYQEWSSVCKLVATVAFAAITITIVSQPATQATKLFSVYWLKWSWLAFGVAGAFAGVSLITAYIWMDFANRAYKPSLRGKLVRGTPHRLLDSESPIRLGTLGWVAAALSVVALLAGLVLAFLAAWMV